MQDFQDLFISYGRRDSGAFAARLNRQLTDRGFTVWFDYEDIPLGVDYQKQIDDAIERADNFLFIISPHSINSPYCALELDLALKYQKRIIPILHVERISHATWQERYPEGTEADWVEYQAKGLHDHFQNMHPVLRRINWVYLREGQDDVEAEFHRLLEIFDRHPDYVHQHTVLLVKALEWERNQKRSPLLLIGEDRLHAEAWLKVQFKEAQPPCLPTELHCEFITESRKNAENLMTEVFLAYADDNRATAEQIRNSLRRAGFTVWTNRTDIQVGSEFQQVIERGIEEADNLVYLLSNAAIASPYCQRELEYALALNKRIIPVLVEAMPVDQIPPRIQGLQYIDLTDNVQAADYQQDESQLLQVLRQDAAYHETHKLLLAKALKWERQHHNPTMLLRGYNLRQAEAWLKLAKQMPAYAALPVQETLIAESLRQPPGISLDVFLSYSRADSGFARRLNEALQIQGKRTWFDQESIAAGTADFQQEIHRGIESADTFLFILSPRSVTSPYCADEVEYATRLNKRIVTVLHRPVDPATLHPELAKVQWLDFTQRDGDFSAHFTELLRILDTDTEHLHAHTRLLLRAIDWDDKGRKESLLLRGDELEQAEHWLAQCVGKEPQPTDLHHSFVTTSRTVEDANQQANQILRAAAAKGEQAEQKLLEAERSLQEATAKGKRRLLIGTIAGAIGLMIAGVSGWFALQATNRVKVADLNLRTTTANEQFQSGQTFQALLTALEAGQTLKTQFQANSPEQDDVQQRIMAVLQQTASKVREKNTLEGHQAVITGFSFSSDGKTIASSSLDKTIKLWDVATGRLLHTLQGHQAEVLQLSFSSNGKTLASASADKTLKLWDVATGRLLHTLQGHQSTVLQLSFSPNGKILASASTDKTLKLWDVATGRLLHTLQGHQAEVLQLSFSPNGKILASASTDKTLKLWDIATGKHLNTFQGHQAEVSGLQFSRDGRTIASASYDETIKLWDTTTGKLLNTLQGHQAQVLQLSFSPDSKTIASTSADTTIKLWDAATGKLLNTLQGHQAEVWQLSFSPDGKTIVSASADTTLRLWDAATGKLLNTLQGHQAAVGRLSFSPDGKTIVSASADRTLKLWDATMGKLPNTVQGHQDKVTSLSFSPDGNTLASASADTTLKLWGAATGKLLNTLQGHQDEITSLSFSPDGKTIASGSQDKTIKLWDTTTGTLLGTFQGHQAGILSLSFSPDGNTLASASADTTLRLWDAATGKLLNTLQGYQGLVNSLSFSPDGKTLASGSVDTTLRLWNVVTGKLLNTLQGHQAEVLQLSFSPDGKTLASASADTTLKLWDATTGKLLHTFQGHRTAVWSLSFSPDGKTIASGSQDRSIKLWDTRAGRLLHTIQGNQAGVTNLSFSPDGKTIASSSWDGTIKLWVWDFDRLMTQGCDWIQDYLITRPEQRHLCQGYST